MRASVEVATARMPDGGSPGHGHVVIVPGFGVVEYLRPTVEALAATGWKVSLLRPPGWQGNRGKRPSRPTATMDGLGQAVARWLRTSGAADVVLVGHSIGAQVAAHAAAAAPEVIRSLVLAGPTTDSAYRARTRLAGRLLRAARHEPPWLVASQTRDWWRTGPTQLRRLLDAAVNDSLETTLSLCSCPRVVVLGEDERLSRPEWVATLPDTATVRIPGGHGAIATDAHDFAAALLGAAPRRA